MNACSVRTPAPFVEVAPDARLSDRRATLTYRVPATIDDVEVGQLIWAPLRRKLVLGLVVERHGRTPDSDYPIKDIHAPVEPSFCLSPIQWQLAVWIAEETICTLYEAASVMLPPGVGSRAVEYLSLRREPPDDARDHLTPAQRRLVDFLAQEGEVTLERAQRSQRSSLAAIIPALEELGLLQKVARIKNREPQQEDVRQQVRLLDGAVPPPDRAPKQAEAFAWLSPRLRARENRALPIETVLGISGIDRPTLRALADRGAIAIEPRTDASTHSRFNRSDVTLTDEQRHVWAEMRAIRRHDEQRTVLLHGVTGSGKTELYLRLAAEMLAEGRSAIVLVP
ncbi:MAG: hypothetical protein WD628_00660 [Thermomicrobiales bacterium]